MIFCNFCVKWKLLDAMLQELKKHPEYDLPEDGGLEFLLEYSNILPETLRNELHNRASSTGNIKS